MRQKLATAIVRLRIPLLILILLCTVGSVFSIHKAKINYDLTTYLDPQSMTRRALTVMQEEFGASEQLRIMFQNISEEEMQSALDQLNSLPEILLATHAPETDARMHEGVLCQLVTLTLNDCDARALIDQLDGMFPHYGEYFIGGTSAGQRDIQNALGKEIPRVMIIAIAVVIVVLLLTSHAWLEPLLILMLLGASILINMGTNFVFPHISYITFAVCAILQMALSIDYGIMLLHSFHRFTDDGLAPREAMIQALSHSLMPIISSAGTTAAGLLSLSFMSFTIGRDIGFVLTKGILVSMITVFLLLPALILLLNKPLQYTRHKPLQMGGEKLAGFIADKKRWIALLLSLVVIAGAVLQSDNTYFFTDTGKDNNGTKNQKINIVYGTSDPLALLIPKGEEDADYDKQRALCHQLEGIVIDGQKAVDQITAMVTTGAAALEYYTPRDVADMTGMNILVAQLFFRTQGLGGSARADKLLAAAETYARDNETIAQLRATLSLAQQAFNGEKYARLLLTTHFPTGDLRTRQLIDEIMALTRSLYGDDFYITGMAMSGYDIGNAFEGDLMKINLITLLAIFLIVACAFRSLRLSLLLVLIIEGAIWITMGISNVLQQPIFFISYLICVSIQMGATIDYAILLTDQYRQGRRALAPQAAMAAALRRTLPTILTSGIIMTMGGFLIGQLCSVFYISSIGLLLARGTLLSMALILTLLPSLLLIGDKWLIKHKKEENEAISTEA